MSNSAVSGADPALSSTAGSPVDAGVARLVRGRLGRRRRSGVGAARRWRRAAAAGGPPRGEPAASGRGAVKYRARPCRVDAPSAAPRRRASRRPARAAGWLCASRWRRSRRLRRPRPRLRPRRPSGSRWPRARRSRPPDTLTCVIAAWACDGRASIAARPPDASCPVSSERRFRNPGSGSSAATRDRPRAHAACARRSSSGPRPITNASRRHTAQPARWRSRARRSRRRPTPSTAWAITGASCGSARRSRSPRTRRAGRGAPGTACSRPRSARCPCGRRSRRT